MKIRNLELAGNVVLAPMAGVTNPPFRRVVQRFGVSAVWTEMISARGLVATGRAGRTMDLRGHSVPTVFQIYGHEPAVMADAARVLEQRGAAAVDLNMGCPARRIVGQGAGAALMKDVPRAGRIVASVRRAVQIPVTVKIRSGWDDGAPTAPGLARVAEQEGADAVVVHARSRSKIHSGPASMSIIAAVRDSVGIPVIGNGGVAGVRDANAMQEATGCDGVMVGRGALGRPWLPAKILGLFPGTGKASGKDITFFDVIREHYMHHMQWEEPSKAVRQMRKHLIWYSKGFTGSVGFRCRIVRLEDPAEVMEAVKEFFGEVTVS